MEAVVWKAPRGIRKPSPGIVGISQTPHVQERSIENEFTEELLEGWQSPFVGEELPGAPRCVAPTAQAGAGAHFFAVLESQE